MTKQSSHLLMHQMAVERGDIIEIDKLDEEESPGQAGCHPHLEIAELCERLEKACIFESGANNSLKLTCHLHEFCGEMRHKELQNAMQAMLDGYWKYGCDTTTRRWLSQLTQP